MPVGKPDRKLIDIDSLASLLVKEGTFQVNAIDWASEWSDQWVAYIDLIGFAAVSKRSPDTVLNWIVRFHRAVSRAKQSYQGLRLHQFTDAAYVVSSSAETVLKYSSDVQHLCMAMNVGSMQVPAPQWHYMLAPRITIAHGRLLQAPDPPPVEPRYDGVDPSSLMAGEALVKAYSIESKSAGSLISINSDDDAAARQQDVRGNRTRLRTVLERWVAGDEMLDHDGVVDFPWLALRADQPSTLGLWADDLGSFWRKVEVYRRMWELHMGDYVRSGAPMDVVKHYGATQRQLALLVQRIRGHRKGQPWNVARLDHEIDIKMHG